PATPLVPVRFADGGRAVRIIDQRRLPAERVERDLRTVDDIVDAISTLAVRGAPAIGVCGAMGLAVAMRAYDAVSPAAALTAAGAIAQRIRTARPTAVNLAWAVDRCLLRAAEAGTGAADVIAAEAQRICDEDLAMGHAIGLHGLELLGDPVRVLTHCNTGALATAGAGTALSVVYAAHAAGRAVSVFATETRPLLQGARLTAWELARARIPVTVLVDSAAAALMQRRAVDAVIVGADRIAANGDTANKIGTFSLAVSAAHHGIPFYVAAPWSTIDTGTATGEAIPIEERDRDEVARVGGRLTITGDAEVWNPAFDVTPASLITAIVTDRGVHRPPHRFV
ncbi:MAG TPA: S-methyl-5-thioribose-1-phosphate isomerase, partial [Gemmatimonadaceae bacterium]|nr:S-methyl-5-thioribose-1-phosphate isomerase [Gemmatimonadaceae bacterium]